MTKNGFALSAGGTYGAYQAGVLDYVFRVIGAEIPITADIFTGTSAGSLNASMMACFANDPVAGAAAAKAAWISLTPNLLQLRNPLDYVKGALSGCQAPFSVFDAQPLRDKLNAVIPMQKIKGQLDSGALAGLAVVATHVETGQEVVFASTDADVTDRPHFIKVDPFEATYVAASISIPLAFQPKKVGNDFFWDGGTRTMMPAWTAYDLGAERILAVSTQVEKNPADNPVDKCGMDMSTLTNRLMRALFLDRADVDLFRMEHMARPAKTLLIRPSKDLDQLSKKYKGLSSTSSNLALWLVTKLSDEGNALVIDPDFARELITLGHNDAAAHHDELVALFSA
jgi:NTE family protein